MARLSASTIYGKLKATGEVIINGALSVKNGIVVESGNVELNDTNTTFTGNHNSLSSISSDDHHAKYTDGEAISAINNDGDHGSTASHNYFSGSHDDLSNISSNDHHTKYTDSEAISAVESGTFNELAFNNIEDPSTNRSIGIDDSEGILFKNGSGNTYPVYTNESVSIGTDLDRSGGSGAGSTPITISHADTSSQGNVSAGSGSAITDINLDGRGHVTSISTSSVGGDNTFSTVNFTDADSDGNNWEITEDGSNGHLNISSSGGGGTQMDIEHNGNVRIEGTITENSSL